MDSEWDFPGNEDDSTEPIAFIAEEIDFHLENPAVLEQWIQTIIQREKGQLSFLNFIFCSDEYLLRLNQEYLQHDTLTDIITFPYQDLPYIEGDIFISIDRVRENAAEFGVSFTQELHRVMIHGVLHLCGHKDKTEADQARMRAKEDEALALLPASH